MTTSFGNILPRFEHLAHKKQKVEWKKEKGDDATRNVLYSFLKLYFTCPSDYSFDKVLVGAKYNILRDEGAILHMKIKKNVERESRRGWQSENTCWPPDQWSQYLRGFCYPQLRENQRGMLSGAFAEAKVHKANSLMQATFWM
ncbi:hypothetical protein M514_23676 [Trichuris suis]|uniref:Uncharacterized protein n=1 Tax=Trichuris suis TaxID=68888 RepID=A0A085N3Z1_9BILA|nr:hypothetical protein M514_23676 [Trichuris suis]